MAEKRHRIVVGGGQDEVNRISDIISQKNKAFPARDNIARKKYG